MLSSPIVERTVLFNTLGCRLNFFESDGLFSSLSKHGFRSVIGEEHPEVVIINTCTVTNKADSKNRNTIRNAIKKFPGSQIWVTGCYAETDRESIEAIPGVAGVVGNTEKSKLPAMILEKKGLIDSDQLIRVSYDRFSYSDVLPNGHTRAYLKIQDGCNRKCSYCKIPQARGLGVSRKYRDVLDQVRFLQDHGVGEIVLTGVNLGWYRDDENKKAFNRILGDILNILEYSRIRISSIEPPDVGNELAELMTHPRFTPFLHVPLQSGSEQILKKMKRTYTPETFRKRVEIAKEKIPDLFLGTDVIVGFPGETEEMFYESVRVVRELGFAKIHTFPFSVRRNTLAETYVDSVNKETKKERVYTLNALSRELHQKYAATETGKIREAILEQGGIAVTDNYLKVKLNDTELKNLKTGQFLNVELLQYEIESDKEGSFLGRVFRAPL
ncbi:tRNA (N(6)-L-threonylcarbamoyladenosine(37)-C(2))-methylthiotransferase MtaB [Leptospira santarosai]|uniref:tRNA (N(6)-L-threonylcarbamoyladenosine(37)-C(2))-methylthiotransferase MtaB n=1 Tax=Leptospira santarosai TaxID=28183 RepID=A0AB73MBP7_9LEPT|nr:tRNA (N(6)-L-threonylcarbamoyladenosine(37)-C(2))-methylthiotransferase MtaB [Leptospira santarosai]AVV80902.1 2-methylthioadenine synthetase [Leptospira santarosai]MDI7163873.1 tRNA (N(6)-L-threonylcarbamoyladenosine(37)-C(2))-methylthiotransferase MtaB [Leptospira santarosai]MDI7163954.1 tRNA (N(6)-L-threonylcarbamoyladenosine(37)-C(2))-methylthiotransferase MtaB [Leptospira santarosai]MDO6392520.1 tRNA (N(6)-L-threonylcarbamoyladenosine(37)-C(2))-methylthiotransferase MtaB [Leptospira san